MFKFAYIDFEFNSTNEKQMNVICCSILFDKSNVRNIWFGDKGAKKDLHDTLDVLARENYVMVGYSIEAEASALISLGYDPLKFKWIDLHTEVKMLYNHNNILSCGNHLIDGKVKLLRPHGEKPNTGLGSSLYKFCDILIDTERKNKMRDIIISRDAKAIEENKFEIMEYCESDVMHLPQLFHSVFSELKKFVREKDNLQNEILYRGEYSVRTAMMVRHGTPINMSWAYNLAKNVPMALTECIKDVNSQFPRKIFKFNLKTCSYVMDTIYLREWIAEQKISNWAKTDKGQYSLALDAWEDQYSYRHDFPRNNLPAQIIRYLKLKQSLSSFNFRDGQKESTFFDYIGSDGFSRPYMNHFGAQSSRTQPKSSGFLFLKSAWMRSMCQPPEGYVIGGIDYSQQEFLLSAVCSRDPKMIQAYKDGDVYLYYGKGIGLIPPNGTKASHKAERDLCKSTVLGLSYLMTKVGLSKKLTSDTGRFVSEDEADKLVRSFDNLFSVFSEWRRSVISTYEVARYLRLPDGWHMFGSNPSHRSAANMPLQGAGAAIMRKAVQLAQDAGVTIIFTLHDAIYLMAKTENMKSDMDTLARCMKEAFIFYFYNDQKESASLIRMDAKVWGPDLDECEIITDLGLKLDCSKIHVDERAQREYDTFKKYFYEDPSLDLL